MSAYTAEGLAWAALFSAVAFVGTVIGPLILITLIMLIARVIFR